MLYLVFCEKLVLRFNGLQFTAPVMGLDIYTSFIYYNIDTRGFNKL